MADSASLVSGLAGRYATALFELAEEADKLSEVEKDLAELKAALADSAALRDLATSPVYSREEQAAAIAAVAEAMGLNGLTRNLLGLMAARRRLFALGAVCDAFAALAADKRGEISAEVRAAAPLTDAQREALADTIRKAVGKDVKLNVAVDESLIGGLVVKVGSRMIDTSIRARLANLQNAMKEVG
ncbi:F0F1 ATP synthase subunit delta [Oceanicella actignis]|uniref:ATP synthase subunit delta n=1 Tax=Oceanicella actignis TaxID=1189325 RepID=A0A1M7T399_9RHOB|nr:F0F1 ATP synthase subunit delta [Oceanicella actignis]SET39852.1 ATP synthase F1 subcomplex delta subunit [Oceanicella actignis]SHN65181.1 F-type H+-transporting ATPase subunit delta [Oceanicella actignis]